MMLCREDSRLHACIVCASISCPNVRREAFRAERIGDQMDDQVRGFLKNSNKGRSDDMDLLITGESGHLAV